MNTHLNQLGAVWNGMGLLYDTSILDLE
jgi:hypothetical protein